MVRRITTLDAHAAGEPLRLIVDGCPQPVGASMLAKWRWARRHLDAIRRVVMHEPRGHSDMYGAVLTEPVEPSSHAGLLFMHNDGFSTMCGHGVIAVVTLALEHGLLHLPAADTIVALDTPAGTVRATVVRRGPRVEAVSFVNVPSFVLRPGVSVRLGSRELRVDVAFGGAFYAIVDAEAAGVPLRPVYQPELRKRGMEVKRAVESLVDVVHPEETALKGIYGCIFTGPPHSDGADLRNVTVFAKGQIDRSPCGSGTAAVMAVLDAMGVGSERPFVIESIIGTTFAGTIIGRTTVAELPAIVASIEGSAWTTGKHEFLIDDEDPLHAGFQLA